MGRPMALLLGGILLFHAGWYLLLPYFALLFTSRRGLDAADVGVLLAAQSFTLLVGSLMGGWLADRVGRRTVMVGGLGLRAAGLWLLGGWTGLPPLVAAASLAGVGGGLYGPAAKAGIAAHASPANRDRAFAARGIAANLGISLGPVAGGLLVGGSMRILFGAAAALHLALAAITWALYREEPRGQGESAGSLRAALADRPYVAFSLVTTLAWALFTQLAIAVPVYARAVLGLGAQVGLLWTASSVVVILTQFGLTGLAARLLSPLGSMALGALLLGGGLGLAGLAGGFAGLLGAVLLFTLGQMLLMPTADSVVSALAPGEMLGIYFGVAAVTWGLGEGVGNLIGGRLLSYALARGSLWLPWTLYAAAGVLLACSYRLLGRAYGHTFGRTAVAEPIELELTELARPDPPALATDEGAGIPLGLQEEAGQAQGEETHGPP